MHNLTTEYYLHQLNVGGYYHLVRRKTICIFISTYSSKKEECPTVRKLFSRLSDLQEIEANVKMVDFLIGHYTYRMFPPAIDIISISLAVAYSDVKYTNQN